MAEFSERAILRLVDHLYEAAIAPECWSHFVEDLTRTFRGEAAWLVVHDQLGDQGNTVVPYGLSEQDIASYSRYIPNPFLDRAALMPESSFLSKDILPRERYEKSEFYNEWVRPLGFFDFAGANLFKTGQMIGALSLFRGDRAGSLDSHEIGCWQALMPHVRRAIQVHSKLFAVDMQQRGALDALYQLGVGLLFVTADRELLFCNDTAERLLGEGRGLRVQGGRLCGDTPEATTSLRKAIYQVLGSSSVDGGGLFALQGASGATLPVLISRVPPERTIDLLARPVAMLLVSDPGRKRRTQLQDLARVFGLTAAEARLLAALTDGLSLAEYSEKFAVSVGTARAQLKQVFAKTGEHRQAAVIRRVLSDPILSHRADV